MQTKKPLHQRLIDRIRREYSVDPLRVEAFMDRDQYLNSAGAKRKPERAYDYLVTCVVGEGVVGW